MADTQKRIEKIRERHLDRIAVGGGLDIPPCDCVVCDEDALLAEVDRLRIELNRAVYALDIARKERNQAESDRDRLRSLDSNDPRTLT